MTDLSVEIVDALNKLSGPHTGFRAAHAKGVCASGTFTPTTEASSLTTAPHMGSPVPVTVRFSIGSGDPNVHDGARGARGMAVKFHLPGGGNTDIVAVSLPAFFVRTPEDFLEFVRARTADPATGVPDTAKVGAFFAAHPEAALAAGASAAALPPLSYATITYQALHAFRWVDPGGTARYVRYRFEPTAGHASLTDPEAQSMPRDYLRLELGDRLAEGPVLFTLYLQIAEDGDNADDPTKPWPESRQVVRAGQVELTGLVTTPEGCEAQIFDPTNVTAGIECSNDQILRARAGAYSVSYERRTA